MNILNSFLIKHFIRILSLSITAFVGLYLLIDFFEKVDDFIEHSAVSADYFVYLTNVTPFIFIQVLPLAILTTMVLTLGGLSRTNEITALRACGVSLWRIVQPLMALTVLLSFIFLLVNEFVIPWNNQQLNYLFEVKIKNKQQIQLTHSKIWYRSNNKIINISLANSHSLELKGVTIFFLNPQQKIEKRQDINIATYKDGNWRAATLTERKFDSVTGELLQTTTLDNQIVTIDRNLEDFTGSNNFNNELNIQQLAIMAEKLEQEGYDSTRQQVDMHNRIATPFTCLIMGFLGVPFALQRGRNSNIALGIGLSLGIGVTYFIIQSLVIAFGYAGAMPPIVAAWTANFIFLMVGIWLLLNVND